MKSILLVSVLLFFSCKSGKESAKFDSEGISPALIELVNNLIETDYIGTEKIGRSPELSPAYANRETIFTLATRKELSALVNHPEGEVAATAFEGLVRMGYEDLKSELFKLAKGDRKLNYIQGDVILTMPALEYATVHILGMELDGETPPVKTVEIGLTDDEKAFIENRIKAIRQTL